VSGDERKGATPPGSQSRAKPRNLKDMMARKKGLQVSNLKLPYGISSEGHDGAKEGVTGKQFKIAIWYLI
jgi:hypothetical protein